jgi:hypothetical protein
VFSAVDSQGQTIWMADAHRGDGKRFIVPGVEHKVSDFSKLGFAVSVEES